ncbi:hypothetical protein BC831DRAFT_505705 [Entophlyctis helioformis]|nr:hypothetical protein BC831DRAFT_505705 [Entophlyctis helioformis]
MHAFTDAVAAAPPSNKRQATTNDHDPQRQGTPLDRPPPPAVAAPAAEHAVHQRGNATSFDAPSIDASSTAITKPPRAIAAPSVAAISTKSKPSKWYDRLICGSVPDIGQQATPAKSASPSVSTVEDDEQRSAPPNAVPISIDVAEVNANKLRSELVVMLEEETARIKTANPSKHDDLVNAIDGHVDRMLELRSQILEEARSAAAVTKEDSLAQAARVEQTKKVDKAFDKLKSVLGSALENHEMLTTACDLFLKEVGEDGVDIDTATVSNIATLSSTVVEFVDRIREAPKKTDGSRVKAVTRFLATNGLEVVSTVISAAKAASHFVPIPGIADAIGIIDNILTNVKDGVDSIANLKDFLDDLKELKAILAPMANQWFSADVRGKCAELVDLLNEVQASIKAGTRMTSRWFMLVIGAKKAEVEAQMAGYRSRLAKIKELISLAMQVDSAVMLMHTAKKLNLIDTKTDRILQFLRPRTLHLRHDDFLISAVPEDSKGTFAVYKAKMDGSEIIVKEFKRSLDDALCTTIKNEARQWFKLSHANLLPITGICLEGKDSRKPFIAMPYMDYDLESYLAKHSKSTTKQSLRILACIARGLKYLHVYAPGAPVVHGSLSMSRIHLDSKGSKVKISVGMQSIRALAGSTHSTSDAKYMAPEAKTRGIGQVSIGNPQDQSMDKADEQQRLQPPVDVYAFGVLAQDVLAQAADQLQRPDNISGDVWQSLQATLKTCLNIKPDDRPNFSSIVKALAMATRPVDAAVVKVQDGASDLEILCSIFPEWAKDSEITVNSERPTGELMNLYDDSAKRINPKWQLEWDEQHNLTALRLTGCSLSGNIPKDIGRLKMLKELWLDQNELDGEIPPGICQLTKLTSLRLGQNNLQGSVPNFIFKLTHLDELDIADNQITQLPASIGKLTQLKTLNVHNNLITELPDTIANLTNLTKLLVGGKAISDISVIGKMISLAELKISKCGLQVLPETIGDLENLEMLDISGNELKEVPSCIYKLKNLAELNISNNSLEGSIPPVLGNLVNLTGLGLWKNKLEGSIPSELGNLVNLTQLRLDKNQLSGTIPAELGNLRNLTQLDLSANQLLGNIPRELGKLVNLTWLYLHENQLSDNIPTELGNLVNLTALGLWKNKLEGSIPPVLGNLVNLTQLRLDKNQLSGTIPAELGNLRNLTQLDLSANQLSGNIPRELGKLVNLTWLYLHENQLSDNIPTELGNLVNLTALGLWKNKLEGSIPPVLGNLVNLTQLRLDKNQLSGTIPAELGNLRNLTQLDLSANQLSGNIPRELGKLVNLTWLYLHENQLSDNIPTELGNLINLTALGLWKNKLEGSIPAVLGNLVNLTQLRLDKNQLSGTIPAELGNLRNLTQLGLHQNQLSGVIPRELGKLVKLKLLWTDMMSVGVSTTTSCLEAINDLSSGGEVLALFLPVLLAAGQSQAMQHQV